MSSNLKIKKICDHCNELFIAQKATTKFCSLNCARRNYKLREKKKKIKNVNETAVRVLQSGLNGEQKKEVAQQVQISSDLIDIRMLATATSLSERTLFRLIKNKDFPKLRIGRSLLFHKETVINYLIAKYGNL